MPINHLDPVKEDVVCYAGVGSRETPEEVLRLMRRFAAAAAKAGWVLRSGDAEGADTAFERGCDQAGGRKRIFYATESDITETGNPNGHHGVAGRERHLETVDQYHPKPEALSGYVRRLMARNSAQVLGFDLDRPANLMVCWTPDGATSWEHTSQETGGTGQAIRIASAYKITVVNLYWPESRQLISSVASSLEPQEMSIPT